MFAALASGIILGLSCGLSPGPLMALVLGQTLRYGTREGCKVAIVPLVSDLPVILIAVAFAAKIAQFDKGLGVLSLVGGGYVLYLAIDHFRPLKIDEQQPSAPNSLLKGTVVNLLNPSPWLFWMSVGAATLARALEQSWLAAAGFLVMFYASLVGSKVLLAIITGRSRTMISGRIFRRIMIALGLLLCVFALILFAQAFKHFGLL